MPAKKDTAPRKLTDAEFQLKREKGFCFRCDEKYSPGHHCKSKEIRELRILLVNGSEEIKLLQGTPSEEAEEITIPDVGELVELDLKSVIGFSTSSTMKLKAKLQEKEVVVLIDCGAMHNFVSQGLVEELNLLVVQTTNYSIVMGNGVATRGKGSANRWWYH